MDTLQEATEPLRLLAFVRPELHEGPVLYAEGAWSVLLRERGSWDIGDLNMPMPPHGGLMVFEGWHETSSPDPTEVSFVGDWREMTHWELCRTRFGMTPFPSGGE
jgi:hypothetical protein